MMSDVATATCANHPSVETLVSCGKCEKPLCPKCMIFTPVGVRCKECARMRPPPQFDLAGIVRVRVLLAAAAFVVVGGGLLGLLHLVGFGLFLSLALGFAVGETLSRVSARKQGRQMELIAGATLVLTLVVAYTVSAVATGYALPHALGLALAGLTNLYGLIGLALGLVLAIGRVR
jgi:hypothetical protein